MLVNKRRLGEVLAVFAINPPRRQSTICIYFLVQIYFEVLIYMDPNYLVNDLHVSDGNGSLATKDTVIYSFFKSINWLNLLLELPAGFLLGIVSLFSCLLVLACLSIFVRFRFLDRSLNMDPALSKKSLFHKYMSNLMHFYDPIYLVTLSLFFRSIYCKDNWVQTTGSSSFSIGTEYLGNPASEVKMVNNQTIVINNNVACRGFEYYFLLFFTSIGLLCSIALKYVQSRLLGGIANPMSQLTRDSFADYWRTLTMCVVVLIRSIFRPYISTRHFDFDLMRVYWILMVICAAGNLIISIVARPYYSAWVNKANFLSQFLLLLLVFSATVIFMFTTVNRNSEWSVYLTMLMIGGFVSPTLIWYLDRESACKPIDSEDELIRRICEALRSDKRVLGREFTDNFERMRYFGIVYSLRMYHDHEFSDNNNQFFIAAKKKKPEVEEKPKANRSLRSSKGTSSLSNHKNVSLKLGNQSEHKMDNENSHMRYAEDQGDQSKKMGEGVPNEKWAKFFQQETKQQAKEKKSAIDKEAKYGSVPTFNMDNGFIPVGAESQSNDFWRAFAKTEKIGNSTLCELYAIILKILERKSQRELLSKDPYTIVHGRFTALLVIFLNFFVDRSPAAISLLHQIFLRVKKQPSQNHDLRPAKISHKLEGLSHMHMKTNRLDSLHYCKLFHLVKLQLIGRAGVEIINQYGARGVENPENRWNLCTTLIVLAEKDKIKNLLSKSYTIKRRFMDELLTKGVNLNKIYDRTCQFITCHDKLRRSFAKINRGTNSAYFPVNVMEAVYLKHFLFSEVEANKKIKEALSRNQINDTIPLFENLQSKSNEITIIEASLEEHNFQAMTFVSTNVKRYLGFECGELIGKKMPLIIPEPIASKHDLLVHPRLIQGHSLGQDMMVKTYARGKNGFISGLGFLMKLNPTIEKGLSVTSSLLFEASSIFKEVVVILGDNGEILELSEVAANHFEKCETFEKYSPILASRLKEVALLNTHILQHGKPTAEEIAQTKWMVNSYQAYFELGRGTAFRMKDKFNNAVYFGSMLFVAAIPRIGKTMQILKLKPLDNTVIETGTLEEFKKIYKLMSPEQFCKMRSISPSEKLIYATMSQLNLCNDEDCVLENLRTQVELDIAIPRKVEEVEITEQELKKIPETPVAAVDSLQVQSALKNSNLHPPTTVMPSSFQDSFERFDMPQGESLQPEAPSEVSFSKRKPAEQGLSKVVTLKIIGSRMRKGPGSLTGSKKLQQKLKAGGSSFQENDSSVPTTRYSITRNYFHLKAHEQLDSTKKVFLSKGIASLTIVWVLFVAIQFSIFSIKQFLRFEFNIELTDKLNYPEIATLTYHKAVVFVDSFEITTLNRMQLISNDYLNEYYKQPDLYNYLSQLWPAENGTGNALQLFDYHRMLRLTIDSLLKPSLHQNIDLERNYVDAEVPSTRDTNIGRLSLSQIWTIYTLPMGQLTDWITIFQSRFLGLGVSQTVPYNPNSRAVSNLVQEALRRNSYDSLSSYLAQRCLDACQYLTSLIRFEVAIEFAFMIGAVLGSVLVILLSITGLAMWQRSMRQLNKLVFSLKLTTFKSAHAEIVFLEDYVQQVIKCSDFHFIAKSWHAIGQTGKIVGLVEQELRHVTGQAQSQDSEKSGPTSKEKINEPKSELANDDIVQPISQIEDPQTRKSSHANTLKEALDVLKSTKKAMKRDHLASKIERIKFQKSEQFDTKLIIFASKLMIIILPFLTHQVIDYLQDYYSLNQIQSLGALYSLMGGIWINLELARVSVDLQLAFGNNYTFNGTTPQLAFQTASDQLMGYYLPQLQQIKRDMSSENSAILVKITEETEYCNLVQGFTKTKVSNCGEGATAFLKGNLILALKSYVSLLATVMSAACDTSRSNSSVAALLNNPTYKAMFSIGFNSNFANDVFYQPLIAMNPKLDTLVDASTLSRASCAPDCNFLQMLAVDDTKSNALTINILLLIVCLLGYFGWVSQGLQRIFRIHTAMSLLLPPELIRENLLLSKYLRAEG